MNASISCWHSVTIAGLARTLIATLLPVFVAGNGAEDSVDAAGLGETPLVGAASLHQYGQQLADVLLVAVHLRILLLCGRIDDPEDPAQELH